MAAENRTFHADFSPTTQSVKTICVQPDKESPSKGAGWEKPSFKAGGCKKKEKCVQERCFYL